MNNETSDGGATVPCISLLAEVEAFRNECAVVRHLLKPELDNDTEAAAAFDVVLRKLNSVLAANEKVEAPK